MSLKDSRLIISEDDQITKVRFVDRNILEEANIQQIGDEIGALIDASNNPRLLIDFENVEHLSSAALGTLITINNKVRSKDGQLRLCNIDAQIFEVFVITKLDKLFQIHQDEKQATASFK